MAEDDPTEGTLRDERDGTTYLEYPAGDGWMVAARVDGALSIIGLAIVPAPGERPEGGLTAEVLSRVRVGDLRRRFLTLVARDAAERARSAGLKVPSKAKVLEDLRRDETQDWVGEQLRTIRPSRMPDSDRMDRLAKAALNYIEAYKRDPSRVLVEMVEEYKRQGDPISYSTARERVREARKAGLLVGGRRGKAGAMASPTLLDWQERQGERSEE